MQHITGRQTSSITQLQRSIEVRGGEVVLVASVVFGASGLRSSISLSFTSLSLFPLSPLWAFRPSIEHPQNSFETQTLKHSLNQPSQTDVDSRHQEVKVKSAWSQKNLKLPLGKQRRG